MRILHLTRNINDFERWILENQKSHEHDIALILMHDAVLSRPEIDIKIFVCKDDVLARGIETDLELIDYEEIVNLIFDYDSVISW